MTRKTIALAIIASVLYIVGFLSSYPYLLDFENPNTPPTGALRSVLEYELMFLSFLSFCIFLLSKTKVLRGLSYVLLLFLSLNFMLSASCFFIYKQGFNVGMTISILETNVSESLSMVRTLIYPISASLVFYIILLMLFRSGVKDKENLSPKFRKYAVFFSLLWLVMPYAYSLKHTYIKNKGGGVMIKNTFYHLSDFLRANNLKKELEEVKNAKVDYQLSRTDTEPVETIVVLVGESQRRQNMSLYGYEKDTTPAELAEKVNMLLYQNAYAPAAITNLAVPIALSNINIQHYGREVKQLSDNILNVANHLGYATYWYSTQGGAQGITAIASFAKEKKYINGYDEALLPPLKQILKQGANRKKLIVLHINGSHPYCCDKYPPKEAVWQGGIDECYDNSIRYTDKIIGQIFHLLKDQNASLIYLSDHGQIKEKDTYKHGDYKEAVQVPLFIWYSASVHTKNRGEIIPETTPTSVVYPKVLELMGVKNPKTINNAGKYLKLDLQTIDYKNLK